MPTRGAGLLLLAFLGDAMPKEYHFDFKSTRTYKTLKGLEKAVEDFPPECVYFLYILPSGRMTPIFFRYPHWMICAIIHKGFHVIG